MSPLEVGVEVNGVDELFGTVWTLVEEKDDNCGKLVNLYFSSYGHGLVSSPDRTHPYSVLRP